MRNLFKFVCVCMVAMALHAQISSFVPPGRKNYLITVTSGTPIQVSSVPVTIDRGLIQMDIAASGGYGSICIVPVGTTPAAQCATMGQLGARLAPGTATAPGGSYSDFVAASGGSINLQTIWIDGSHTGDPVIVSVNVK